MGILKLFNSVPVKGNLRQWDEENIGGDYETGHSVCPYVCPCVRRSVRLCSYTTCMNGGALMWKPLHWRITLHWHFHDRLL